MLGTNHNKELIKYEFHICYLENEELQEIDIFQGKKKSSDFFFINDKTYGSNCTVYFFSCLSRVKMNICVRVLLVFKLNYEESERVMLTTNWVPGIQVVNKDFYFAVLKRFRNVIQMKRPWAKRKRIWMVYNEYTPAYISLPISQFLSKHHTSLVP